VTSSSSQTLHQNATAAVVQQIRDDDDEVLGHMDEDNELPGIIVDSTVNKMDDDDDNSELPLAHEEQSPATKEDIDESSASLLARVVSAPTMPITISRNIDIPAKKESNISFSVMETSSLGKLGISTRKI
jgi:hypothetical protein